MWAPPDTIFEENRLHHAGFWVATLNTDPFELWHFGETGKRTAQGFLLKFSETSPTVYYNDSVPTDTMADLLQEVGHRFSVIPRLAFADEGAVAVSHVMGGLRFWGRPMAAIVPCHCLLEGLKIREDGTTRAGYYDGACIPPPRRVFRLWTWRWYAFWPFDDFQWGV